MHYTFRSVSFNFQIGIFQALSHCGLETVNFKSFLVGGWSLGGNTHERWVHKGVNIIKRHIRLLGDRVLLMGLKDLGIFLCLFFPVFH